MPVAPGCCEAREGKDEYRKAARHGGARVNQENTHATLFRLAQRCQNECETERRLHQMAHLLQIRPTWPGHPRKLRRKVEDANPLWTAHERTVLAKVEKYLQKRGRSQVKVRELEYFLLCPGDADISITSFAENAGDEGSYNRFVLIDTPRGKGSNR